jgi:hypothetical protein
VDRNGLLIAIEGPHTAERATDAVIEFVRRWMAENIDPIDWNQVEQKESEAWEEAMKRG